MSESGVSLTVDAPVAHLRLERPEKLNAFTYRMIAELRAAMDRAVGDPSVVGIVVTGEGRAFSAGLDMEDLARSASGGVPSGAAPDPDELPALFGHLLRCPKPVIGAINGVAAGGGFVLAMMCDVRFGSPSASFTTAFSKRGLVAEHGTSWLLPRLVGTSRALDLLWSARRIDAQEAYHIGFLDRIVDGDVVAAAADYVRELAATVSPASIATMKEQVYRGWSQALGPALAEVDREVKAALDHPDATEGVASFVERRAPQFAPLDRRTIEPRGTGGTA